MKSSARLKTSISYSSMRHAKVDQTQTVILKNVWHSIPVKPTQSKSRDIRNVTTARNLALFPGEIILAV